MKTQFTLSAVTALMFVAGSVHAGGCSKNKGGMAKGYGHPTYLTTGYRYGGNHFTGYQQPRYMHAGYGYGHPAAVKTAGPDIVDTAVAAGSFGTLVQAVKAAGLVDVLKGEGPFTVFAPTDEAFAKLPAGTLESLLADKEKLAQILKYHVVAGKLDAAKVTSMSELSTVSGDRLPVSSIKVADTDIMTSNGIIHVIDEVLIPNS